MVFRGKDYQARTAQSNFQFLKQIRWLCAIGLLALLTAACGGGSSNSPSPPSPSPSPGPTTQSLDGAGVKGPMANAIVKVYNIDFSKSDYKGTEVASGMTNNAAQITGVALPLPLTAPYLMEFTSDTNTVDITTGKAPVLTTLRTILTDSMLSSSAQLYATPLTTIATDLALSNSIDTASLLIALPNAATQVVSTLGFGTLASIDIFTTPFSVI